LENFVWVVDAVFQGLSQICRVEAVCNITLALNMQKTDTNKTITHSQLCKKQLKTDKFH